MLVKAAWMMILAVLLAGCQGESVNPLQEIPTPTLTGPTIEASPALFTGPPTEGPPSMDGAVGVSDATAAASSGQDMLPPLLMSTPGTGNAQTVEITLSDGVMVMGLLYQAAGARQPGVLLLGPEASDWGSLPQGLSDAGYTVLVLAISPTTTAAEVSDMLESLAGVADSSRIGALGASVGADAVLRGCAANVACDTAILISPGDSGLRSVIHTYNPRPLLLVASDEDSDSFTVAQGLHDAATGDVMLQTFTGAGHGLAILHNRPDLYELLLDWLMRTL